MLNAPSYCSYLLRLWRVPTPEGKEGWRGEIEEIQSGAVVPVSSLEEAFRVIRRNATQRARNSHPGTLPPPTA